MSAPRLAGDWLDLLPLCPCILDAPEGAAQTPAGPGDRTCLAPALSDGGGWLRCLEGHVYHPHSRDRHNPPRTSDDAAAEQVAHERRGGAVVRALVAGWRPTEAA